LITNQIIFGQNKQEQKTKNNQDQFVVSELVVGSGEQLKILIFSIMPAIYSVNEFKSITHFVNCNSLSFTYHFSAKIEFSKLLS
jgi:hypothetical protein